MPNPFRTMNNTYNSMPDMSNLRQAYQMFKNAGNPMQVLSNMAMNNPQMKPIMDAFSRGERPETIFRRMCQERNIDPNEFIKNITG